FPEGRAGDGAESRVRPIPSTPPNPPPYAKKTPLRSCPTTATSLVDVSAGSETNVAGPPAAVGSLADQTTVAELYTYSPAKPLTGSLTLCRVVIVPPHWTVNERVAGIDGP